MTKIGNDCNDFLRIVSDYLPAARGDPPDVRTSRGPRQRSPRLEIRNLPDPQNAIPTDSRQWRNCVSNNVVALDVSLDPHRCAVAIACDDVRNIRINDRLTADLAARGTPEDRHAIRKLFVRCKAELQRALALYEGA